MDQTEAKPLDEGVDDKSSKGRIDFCTGHSRGTNGHEHEAADEHADYNCSACGERPGRDLLRSILADTEFAHDLRKSYIDDLGRKQHRSGTHHGRNRCEQSISFAVPATQTFRGFFAHSLHLWHSETPTQL